MTGDARAGGYDTVRYWRDRLADALEPGGGSLQAVGLADASGVIEAAPAPAGAGTGGGPVWVRAVWGPEAERLLPRTRAESAAVVAALDGQAEEIRVGDRDYTLTGRIEDPGNAGEDLVIASDPAPRRLYLARLAGRRIVIGVSVEGLADPLTGLIDFGRAASAVTGA
ncbi:hypothetical protein [Allonocardiopsis opalescens]|uniref:Uncharacterized protein n=1 Tax=Allonocardiopsis opalescens TaxID=1144618 RepID=A0A2T0PU67_9ACTN|nr:hypothetical protein [Allonocardiopsis opalescens]PRX92445.1 hypothetical protein CLV72_110205 [Allonocardiopsis opalescens]